MQQEINREPQGRHVRPSGNTDAFEEAMERPHADDVMSWPSEDATRTDGIYGLDIKPHHSRHHGLRMAHQVLVALATIVVVAIVLLLIWRLL